MKRIVLIFLMLLISTPVLAGQFPKWGIVALFAGDLPEGDPLGKTIRDNGTNFVNELKKNKEVCANIIIDRPVGAVRHEINRGKHRVWPMGRLDLGSPLHLEHHLIKPYRRDCFAEKEILILSSHGSGWSGSIGGKRRGLDSLKLKELKLIFSKLRDKVDIIALDICSMSSLETATELAPFTDYLLAAEKRLDKKGINWSPLFSLREDTTVEEIAENLFKETKRELSSSTKLDGDLTLFETKGIEKLNSNIKELILLTRKEYSGRLDDIKLWHDPFEDGNPNSDLKTFLLFLSRDPHSSTLLKRKARETISMLTQRLKMTTSRFRGGLSWYVPRFVVTGDSVQTAHDHNDWLKEHQSLKINNFINWTDWLTKGKNDETS